MADKLELLAFAVKQSDTSRKALLKFTLATAWAYHEANVVEGDKAADEVKAAIKKSARDRGQDRKTVDRWVNNACGMAVFLAERLNPLLNWDASLDEVADEALAELAKVNVNNIAQLAVWCGVAKPEKVKAEKGADLAATIGAMADAGNPGERFAGKPSEPKPEPKAAPQNEAFGGVSLDLTALDDAALAMLAEMVAAEMTARAQRKALAIAA